MSRNLLSYKCCCHGFRTNEGWIRPSSLFAYEDAIIITIQACFLTFFLVRLYLIVKRFRENNSFGVWERNLSDHRLHIKVYCYRSYSAMHNNFVLLNCINLSLLKRNLFENLASLAKNYNLSWLFCVRRKKRKEKKTSITFCLPWNVLPSKIVILFFSKLAFLQFLSWRKSGFGVTYLWYHVGICVELQQIKCTLCIAIFCCKV